MNCDDVASDRHLVVVVYAQNSMQCIRKHILKTAHGGR
jgi:hypothetical protein